MSGHGITCDRPPCPFFEDGERTCRAARPVAHQPDLRIKAVFAAWPILEPGAWCGVHPAVKAFARAQERAIDPRGERQ